jgi:hypothetical protein
VDTCSAVSFALVRAIFLVLPQVVVAQSTVTKNFAMHSLILESLLVDTCSFFDSFCQTFIREKSIGPTFKQEVRDFTNKVESKADFNCRDDRVLLEGDFALSKREVNLNRYEDKLCLNPMNPLPTRCQTISLCRS